MKNNISKIILLILLLTISGCSTSENQCVCCNDGLFESIPIQDLIDGDNKWMGMKLGITEAQQIEVIFKDIHHEFCYWKQNKNGSEKICGDIPEEYYTNSDGYLFVYLPDVSCAGFGISWKLDKVDQILFACRDCITVDQLFSQIGEPSYINAFPNGLHESELSTNLFYPVKGLKIPIEILDPFDPQLTETTTIISFSLTLPSQNNERSTVKELMTDMAYSCLREWIGCGDIVDLYYSGNSDGICPYGGE